MVHSCAVPMCGNTSNTPGVSFHRFPSNKMKRKAWIIRMRRDETRSKRITSYSRVCSAHFLKSDFKDLKSGRRELKDDVEPTVFPFPSCTQKEPLYVLHPKDDSYKKLEEAWKKLNIPVTQKPIKKPEPVILKKSLEEIALINNATVSTINVGKQTAAIICPNAKTSENSSCVPQTSSNSVSPAPTKVVLKFVPDVSSEKPNSFIPVFYVLPQDTPNN